MINSILEITENEYCIKLNKDAFNFSLIRQLISRIQVEEMFCNNESSLEEDIISKNISDVNQNFDRLDEK
jgi:hypothetical protein